MTPRVIGCFELRNPEISDPAKRIIPGHGGGIRAESEGPGKGARFRFTLPGAGDASNGR